MRNVLENLLLQQDRKKYNSYKMLKEILIFISKNNNFTIDDSKFITILNTFFDENKGELKSEDFIDELILFLMEIITYYEEGKFERFNFLLEEGKLIEPLKVWLKENKEYISNIFEYYYKDLLLEKREEIAFNNYFSITKISKDKSEDKTDEFFVPNINVEDIHIRVLLKGKLFYRNGIFLKEGEYLITDYKFQLGKYRLLSDNFLMILITIKKEFIEEFQVKEVEKIIQVISTLESQHFKRILDKNIFKEDFIFFLDIIILILKGSNLISNEVLSSAEIFFKKELDICNLIDTIDHNITLPEEEIKNILLKNFDVNEKRLEEFMYNSYKTTLKKYIGRQKIKYILEEYLEFPTVGIESILEKYNYSNMKNFRYNLKSFYNLSIKDLGKKL